MRQLGTWEFDVYALSLPRGHGFGETPPVAAFLSDDGNAWATICRHDDRGFSYFVMRRRTDHVWSHAEAGGPFDSREAALEHVAPRLDAPAVPAPVPPGVQRRPPLFDASNAEPSPIIKLMATASHRRAGWLLNQVYLAFPKPDPNWASDLQAGNFHTRLWEAQLLASFREQGLLVTQPADSPDFKIENRRGGVAWVEAVTANATEPYEHVNAPLVSAPEDKEELYFGEAAVRFAKSIGSKLDRNYHDLPHVRGHPFALAVADFHASGSMNWSRASLVGYLYGIGARVGEIDGRPAAKSFSATTLRGTTGFQAGLFANPNRADLSAVIFSNACSVAKFNRVVVSGAGAPDGYRYIRTGAFADWADGALEGIPFSLDVTSDEYRSLWPHGYEPWCAELEVFHNPFAVGPLSHELLPEAMHWLEQDGEMVSSTIYPRSVLYSRTDVLHEQTADAPIRDNGRGKQNLFNET